MMLRLFILSFCLVGCATPYWAAKGPVGGYSETWYEENVVRVAFKGNAYTSRERAADFVLLRAAELALEKGYPFLVVAGSDYYEKRQQIVIPGSTNTTTNTSIIGTGTTYGATTTVSGTSVSNSYTTYTPSQVINMSKPRQSAIFVLYKSLSESGNTMPSRASFLASSISAKYGIKLTASQSTSLDLETKRKEQIDTPVVEDWRSKQFNKAAQLAVNHNCSGEVELLESSGGIELYGALCIDGSILAISCTVTLCKVRN